MEKNNFALRLLPSLYKAAQRVAERENCSVNQLINVALAEKLAVLDAEYWKERRRSASKSQKTDVLKRLPGNEPPVEGDELPKAAPSHRASRTRKTLTVSSR